VAVLLEAVERRIQRPVFHLEDVVRRALDVRRDSVAVKRAQEQRSQDQQIERALYDFPFGHGR
jgi:hypothetical protein